MVGNDGEQRRPRPVVAWVATFGGIEAIVLATRRALAHQGAYHSIQDAGFRVKWTEIRVCRARNYDILAGSGLRQHVPYSIESAERAKAAMKRRPV